jgi:hypothetical protein
MCLIGGHHSHSICFCHALLVIFGFSVNQDGLQTILNIASPAAVAGQVTGHVINPDSAIVQQKLPHTAGGSVQQGRSKSVINIAPGTCNCELWASMHML